MSPGNLVSATLSAEDQAALLAALATIREKLPFLINLRPEDRRRLLKMGDGSRAFVEAALRGAQANPRVFPPSFDLAEFANDWALREALLPVAVQVEQLAEMLDDTTMALGSDLMTAATSAYGYLQQDKSAGTDILRAALAARFKKGGAPAAAAKPATPN